METDFESVAVLIANIVYGYQGSDPEVQKKQVNKKAAGNVLREYVDAMQPKLRFSGEIKEEVTKVGDIKEEAIRSFVKWYDPTSDNLEVAVDDYLKEQK